MTAADQDTTPRVGDTVRIGKGRKLWRIESFWPGHPAGTKLARLVPLEGYTATSADLERLVIIERAQA